MNAPNNPNFEQIVDVADVPDVLNITPGFSPQDGYIVRIFLRILERKMIHHLLLPGDDEHLHSASVGICCQFCAMATAVNGPIAPGAFVFPKNFCNEELVDRIEDEFKVHCMSSPNAPLWTLRVLTLIENGDTPNNVWRGALEETDIIEIDHIEDVDGEYVEFKSLVFNPEIYGWPFED